MTSRLSLYVFSSSAVACAILVVTSSASMPDNVAIHFNAKSDADGWVSREQYRVLILLFLIGLPLFLVCVMAWLPRLTGGRDKYQTTNIGLRASAEARQNSSYSVMRVGSELLPSRPSMAFILRYSARMR